MDVPTWSYFGQQLALFPPAENQITVEITAQLYGHLDSVTVGMLVRDAATEEWIACQHPVLVKDHPDLRALGEWLGSQLASLRELLAPF